MVRADGRRNMRGGGIARNAWRATCRVVVAFLPGALDRALNSANM
jgi:hypothetical protein